MIKYFKRSNNSMFVISRHHMINRVPRYLRTGTDKSYLLNIGSFSIKSTSKPKQSENEDSYSTSKCHICVADGVGGWNVHGINPAKYSRVLTKSITRNIKELDSNNKVDSKNFLSSVLHNAYKEAEESNIIGSSTVCLVYFNGINKLYTANLGDSGCLVYRRRDNSIIYETPFQQHSFNTPFQLGTGSRDSPNDAIYDTIEGIQEGDVILIATDGLWDNLSKEEIIDILSRLDKRNPQVIAEKLGKEACQISLDPHHLSPYAINLAKYLNQRNIDCQNFEKPIYYTGGKPDDITILIGIVEHK
ncbi:protein phophatase 2C [Cryptosporidium andersoni]|uniref:Protein phosphatase n=1 Tax=Cryptosporidium andersoni TaxID=117008 RepID=A0A1J4MDM5_9CRYT|nr:protein phophatase 2C [Cryptosporidium andersoni]